MSQQQMNETGSALTRRVADEYRAKGYRILIEPAATELPFDLGTYRPDIVAVRGDEKLLIEVKSSTRREPLDYLVEAASRVRRHPEWRLLLVTAEDVSPDLPGTESRELPSWAQLRSDFDRIAGIETSGAHWATALATWSLIEAILRRRCIDEGLPVDRLPTMPLLNEMYTHGDLSLGHYDALMAALPVRNNAAHGFVADGMHDIDVRLRELAAALLDEWQPAGSVA